MESLPVPALEHLSSSGLSTSARTEAMYAIARRSLSTGAWLSSSSEPPLTSETLMARS
jgi:hypothetical protein